MIVMIRSKRKYKKKLDPILAQVERDYGIHLSVPFDTTAEEYLKQMGLPSLAEFVRLVKD